MESFSDPLDSPRFQPLIFSFSAGEVSLDVYFKRFLKFFILYSLYLYFC